VKLSRLHMLFVVAFCWGVLSWFAAGWYTERKVDVLLTNQTQSLENDSLALYQAFEERLNRLAALPGLISRLPDVETAAARYSGPAALKRISGDPKAYWETRPELMALNQHLKALATELKLDLVYVLNAEGYIIAANNAGTPKSIVGTLVSDRLYFQTAIKGEAANQYAVGRNTSIPGLYYASPVKKDNAIVGVMAIKSDVPTFLDILMPYGAFLTDRNGVVVLSSKPEFLNHLMDGEHLMKLSEEEKQLRYKRTTFPELTVTPWDTVNRWPLVRVADLAYPVLLRERKIPGGDLVMHVYEEVPELNVIQQEKWVFALVAALAGFSLLTLSYQLVQYLSRLRLSKVHAEAESERLTETLSEREQQLDTILNHLPLMVVARDPVSHKVLSTNAATKQVLGLAERLPTGTTYDDALNSEVAGFLTADDQQIIQALGTGAPRELQLADRVLQARNFAAADRAGQPRLLIDMVEDITQQRLNEAEIRRLAFIDTLTGLNNRASLKLHLEKAVAYALNSRIYGVMILIDLDAFKQINDRFGHNLGDQLLVELARRLPTDKTPELFMARLASDEFVVVIDSCCKTQAEAIQVATDFADALFKRITQPYTLSHHVLNMTASLGVALFGPGAADSADLVLIQADAAMYEAKRRQRGTIQFFDENTQKHLNEQADMANRLRGALQENNFIQLYQPQVDHNGRVIGVEALLRWHDPKLGHISPAVFIPLAESMHLIADIDRWVLKQACRVAAAWKNDPVLAKVVISVNVSSEFFSQDHFVDLVNDYLLQAGAQPAQIMIEITEGTVVEDTEANIRKIKALHDAGLGIAIDDFGTGNSSLAYLRRFDVDQIKIDQRFVNDMIQDERSLAITTFIIQLAHELGYETLAEGVEIEAQRARLESLGCTLLQGFLFSKALPLIECETYIHHANPATH